ncbi:hypothetical protein L6164_020435 [Bauhinia variegata]|uniref:Uncharacterized protein n=1 Tax=Bauhinia variegata TaxID=167791 RepID=A0ACB9MX39_BAUVA|nr:hypothetical protein L6164_020435 [Bauhinia variegata]
MVLWEITLATAYFLGLKRTYRLGLRIQRKLITPKHPKIREFAHGRTRAAFDLALKVHRNIQERDIEVGRNLGNFILRWLDRMKPSAQIRRLPLEAPRNGANSSVSMTKHLTGNSNQKPAGYTRILKRESDRHSFTASSNIWPRPSSTIAMMMRPPNPVGTSIHYRQHSIFNPEVLRSNYGVNWSEGAVRKNILQWIQRN